MTESLAAQSMYISKQTQRPPPVNNPQEHPHARQVDICVGGCSTTAQLWLSTVSPSVYIVCRIVCTRRVSAPAPDLAVLYITLGNYCCTNSTMYVHIYIPVLSGRMCAARDGGVSLICAMHFCPSWTRVDNYWRGKKQSVN